jgi:hypothetical protein
MIFTPAMSAISADPAKLHIVVSYATAQQEILRELWMEQGATLGDAVAQSGILQLIGNLAGADPAAEMATEPPTNLPTYPTGIFGKKKPPETLLRDGDRVELYRALFADPKETRRRRAGGKPAAAVGPAS